MKIQYKKLYKPILLAMTLAFLVTFIYQPTIVKNYSMSPTLEENHLLIVNNRFSDYKSPSKGDIIVFKTHIKNSDEQQARMIKRVIGLAGDWIIIRDGKVYVNSHRLEEYYLKESYTDGEVELTVPTGKVFVMGDNRALSLDSRDDLIGLIDYNEIVGKARFRVYPLKKIGFIK